ncbi:amidohydrolase [Alteromonas sp. 5E99-2]|uniref:amidohydrolase n=1 Tax=Alteromonas sp. 5E99-2 TaxID=2817683 RepID=UPI001A999621|nr:amidohydrolase [Alteromonas sp. 5E99-2]MBO1254527.1 amidohydrolase [Alteromonas sp. 5E99-2]
MKAISTLLFVLISLPSFAFDLVVTNVTGYTLDENGKTVGFQSLLVDNGKVVSLNPSPSDIAQAEKKIDGKGKVMLPGLIDAHGHLLGLGDQLRQVNLRGTTSEADSVSRVKQVAKNSLGASWLLGRGWNQELWSSKSFPTRHSLDDVDSPLPMMLMRVDGHAMWVNSKALAVAQITKDTPNPEGGIIVKDENGEPTGVLIDKAMNLIRAVLPEVDFSTMHQQLTLASEHLLSQGVTGMHDAGITRDQYEFYIIKAAQNQLPIRIYAMVAATDPDIEKMLSNGYIQDAEDMLSIRSVKVYGDGALGSRGAALLTPYSDKPSEQGLLLTPEDKMFDLFSHIAANKFQINYHAIGDRANRLALDTFEAVFKKQGGKEYRHRVEHAQVINVDDLARFPSLGVLPSMQPTHATSDMNMAESRVGHERIKGAYAWQTLIKLGSRLPLGSDFPVELANPFYGIHAAVTRQSRENQPVEGWYANEALTLEQALDGFTRTAAYASHMEDKVGRLAPGFWADFILVDQDPFKISKQDLWKLEVQSTWIAGEEKYRNQN